MMNPRMNKSEHTLILSVNQKGQKKCHLKECIEEHLLLYEGLTVTHSNGFKAKEFQGDFFERTTATLTAHRIG
jgi:hypothetical protein